MNWISVVVSFARSALSYVGRRFIRKASLRLSNPRSPFVPCLIPDRGLQEGFVPQRLELREEAPPSPRTHAAHCLCLEVCNDGWDEEARNCFVDARLCADRTTIPIVAYWMTRAASDAEYVSIPPRGRRKLALALLIPDTGKAVFCTWVYPERTSATSPSWQLERKLGKHLHLQLEIGADNAPSRFVAAHIETNRVLPYKAVISLQTCKFDPDLAAD